MQYRSEIDGLRAIAIIPVILFHGNLLGASGGYVGVDVFFVISGFLISSIIIEEIQGKSFSIISFYERRIRRILPALTLVLISTTLLAFLFFSEDQFKEYSQSLLYTTLFLSNIYFLLTDDYFSPEAEQLPLLHTWSLSVEEQFYIILPIILVVLLSYTTKKKILLPIGIIIVLSLICSHVLLFNQHTSANYYLPFSRFWELFLGSAIALIKPLDRQPNDKTQNILSISGLLLIIFSIFYFDEYTPFPSLYTLLPTVGASLVLLYANNENIAGRILRLKALVGIGLISYSLYLWHQPIYVFLSATSLRYPTDIQRAACIPVIFILALVSYKYVETPFRNKNKVKTKSVFQFLFFYLLIFLSAGILGTQDRENDTTVQDAPLITKPKYSPLRKKCHTEGINYIKPSSACTYFSKNVTWAALGDSHIVEPAYALAGELQNTNEGLLHLTFSGCPPLLTYKSNLPGCSDWLKESIEYIEKDNKIKNVLIGFRYSSYLYGDHVKSYPNTPNVDPSRHIEDNINLNSHEIREIIWNDFNNIISRFIDAEKSVYILYPVPELPKHINSILKLSTISNDPEILENTTPSSYYAKRNAFILDKLNSLNYSSKLHAIKPFDMICNLDWCPVVIDNEVLYFDDDHLSVSGATYVIKKSWRAGSDKN